MPNINTALVSLWSKKAVSEPSYALILIFCLLVFAIFSQRAFDIKSQYYILIATLLILLVMLFIIASLFASQPQLLDNNIFVAINNMFDSSSSRNFLSVVSLIMFVMLVYELAEYDNNDPHLFLDKILLGKNNYISNRTSGIMLVLGFSLFVSYTIMKTTRQ